MDADVGPDDLEEPGDEVDLDVEVLERADQIEHGLVRVVREGDDDALDVEDLHHLRELLETAEQCDVSEVLRPLLGVAVHEADEVEAVLGMLAELLRDELAHVSRADDYRVLDVGEVLPRNPARDRSARRDADDGEQPEAEQAREARVGTVRDRGEGEEQPAPDRDEMEDADEVVGR